MMNGKRGGNKMLIWQKSEGRLASSILSFLFDAAKLCQLRHHHHHRHRITSVWCDYHK